MSQSVIIFDTTLRDGLQSPHIKPVSHTDRVAFGLLLNDMGIDVIEAGFAIASKLDFNTIATLAQKGLDSTVCSLARSNEQDIDAAGKALQGARRSRIHTFISTSPLHMEHKLRMLPEDVLDASIKAVKHAAKYTDDVQFSLEDFTRTEHDFAKRVIEAVIDAGASTVNLPDTVGYSTPDEMSELIDIAMAVPNADKAVFSMHCHNDLGLAVANSLSGALAGARQIECTINGLGERAGNAAMEELVMAMRTRNNRYPFTNNIKTEKFMEASNFIAEKTGLHVQKNKAIVGKNAFAHESGIHQNGMSKNRNTYEIMTPESVGQNEGLTLGVTSGREGLRKKAENMGFNLDKDQLARLYDLFMVEAANGRVSDRDIGIMIENLI
ncbi:MAG: 2-isopropylmalate synthase [Alphaproteobacteria bacterium]|nr:2-isopropylmalate synthase [Alphaproteobacteria bacterium]